LRYPQIWLSFFDFAAALVEQLRLSVNRGLPNPPGIDAMRCEVTYAGVADTYGLFFKLTASHPDVDAIPSNYRPLLLSLIPTRREIATWELR
jgi:hypothetical protein